MRWPWQRVAADDGGQARGSGGGAEAPSAASGASGASGHSGQGGTASTAYSPAGWAFLPPVQRQIADAPPATLRAGWVDALPTRVIPSRVAELTHVVDSAAPSGTVAAAASDLGVPVQRAAVADLTLRPPQTAAELARERRAVVQRQAASGPSIPSASTPEPVADAAPAVVAETSDAQADESPMLDLQLTGSAGAESEAGDPAIAETPITAERMPVADAPHPSSDATNAGISSAAPAPDLALPGTVQRSTTADAAASAAAPPDDVAPVEEPPAASAPVDLAETPTIAASPPTRDPGRLGLAAPLPHPSASADAAPAMPTNSSTPVQRATVQRSTVQRATLQRSTVQRSTGAAEPTGRRMGLGAPLAGGLAGISESVPVAGGAEVGPVPDVVAPDLAAEETSTPIPSPSAVQREAAATPGAAVSSGPPADPAASALGRDDRDGAAASDRGAQATDAFAERPAGLGAGANGLDPESMAGSPVDWAAPVDLALQRLPSSGDGDGDGDGNGADAAIHAEASAEGEPAASDGFAPDGGAATPTRDRAPAPHVVPLIAQRSLESSFDAVTSSGMPVRPRAVPATAVVVDPMPTTSSASVSSQPSPARAAFGGAAIQRESSGVQREGGAASGPGAPAATSADRAAGTPAESTAPTGGVFGWVQRTFGRTPPPLEAAGSAGPTGAAGATGAPGETGAIDAFDAPDDSGTGAEPAQYTAEPSTLLTTTPGFGAPPLAVSRLAVSEDPGPGSDPGSPRGAARQSLPSSTAAALRSLGPTPVAVQRASQTIAGPPVASVSRMVLPVASTPPARRSDGGFDAPDATTWSGDSGPVVQTAVDPGATPPAEPPSETASAPPVGGAAGAAGAAAGGSAGGIDTSPAGIETLAGRLYGPLARRLKAELLLDRERRGIRIDGI